MKKPLTALLLAGALANGVSIGVSANGNLDQVIAKKTSDTDECEVGQTLSCPIPGDLKKEINNAVWCHNTGKYDERNVARKKAENTRAKLGLENKVFLPWESTEDYKALFNLDNIKDLDYFDGYVSNGIVPEKLTKLINDDAWYSGQLAHERNKLRGTAKTTTGQAYETIDTEAVKKSIVVLFKERDLVRLEIAKYIGKYNLTKTVEPYKKTSDRKVSLTKNETTKSNHPKDNTPLLKTQYSKKTIGINSWDEELTHLYNSDQKENDEDILQPEISDEERIQRDKEEHKQFSDKMQSEEFKKANPEIHENYKNIKKLTTTLEELETNSKKEKTINLKIETEKVENSLLSSVIKFMKWIRTL